MPAASLIAMQQFVGVEGEADAAIEAPRQGGSIWNQFALQITPAPQRS